jgi:BirA family biotin operon repressor/biotin-[acetyl-CoA-carboxylase] ligase
VSRVIEVIETGSTNTDLLALARSGAPEGTWLRAERQTGGRGRQGRSWSSPPGNLYASTLVRVAPADPPALTLALVAAVALHETACVHSHVGNDRHGTPELLIKWPNDLLAGSPQAGWAKLAGILLERADDAVVIGIGVNLAHHPTDLDRPTTSLAALIGTAPEPATFLDTLAEIFARTLAEWRRAGLQPIRTRWLAAAHPPGTALSTPAGDGLFDGLDETGALRLRLADGSTHVIHAGDVFLI